MMSELLVLKSLLYLIPLVVFGVVVFELLPVETLRRVLVVAVFLSLFTLSYLWLELFQCCVERSERSAPVYLGEKLRLLTDSFIVLALYLYISKVINFDRQ